MLAERVGEKLSISEYSRRGALAALAAGGLGFAVFGPRGERARGDGRVVLDYWEKWTGHEGKAMQRVVDDFNASQSRLFVRYMVTAGIDQKALVAIAGGDPPDIVGLWNYNVPLFAETGAIHPVDDLGASLGVRAENFASGMRAVLMHKDASGRERMWGTVSTGGTLALYYNKGQFREVGLDPERPPRTIEELDAFAARLDRSAPGGAIERCGFLHTEPGWWSWIWGYQFGGTLYDAADDRARAASPENIAAFEWLQGYSRRLGVERVKTFKSRFANDYSSPRNAFLAGECAMVVQGPWLANVINEFNPGLDYGVAAVPVPGAIYDERAPIALVDTDILVVPRGCSRPEASMEFIAYTQRPEVAEFLSTAHCKASPLATASDAFMDRHPNKGVRVHYELSKSPRAYLCPRTRIWPLIKDEFDAAMQRMWSLDRPAKEELAIIQSRMQAGLDHARGQRERRGHGRGSGG
jgi:ABC-type glycerol-3-phosphate transport system substrate-binding protein